MSSCISWRISAGLNTMIKQRLETVELQSYLFGLFHEYAPVFVEPFEDALELTMLEYDLAGALAVGVEGGVGELFFEADNAPFGSVDLTLHGYEPRGDNVLPLVETGPDPAARRTAAAYPASFSRVQASVGTVVVVAAEVVDELPAFQLDDSGGELAQEVAVVRDKEQRPLVPQQGVFKGFERGDVEVVSRLVQ